MNKNIFVDETLEILDVVDEHDVVVGEMNRCDINKKLLSHRIVHVLIFDKNKKLLLQKRSAKKSFCPRNWSTSVGGHVQKGETYERAALREFVEELGFSKPVELLFKTRFDDPRGFFMFLEVFKATYEGEFKLDPDDVESVEYFSREEINKMIETGEKFHPELKFILKEYEKVIFD
ncbi:MAG: NUDIX domain-containing protein [Candidatus Woesearchaeota archaeon]|jgi:isopentenyldiphosphate isomerase